MCIGGLLTGHNPAVTRLGTEPARAFAVSRSAVFGAPVKAHKKAFPDAKHPPASNLSPFFHDWKLQYETAAELLRKQNFATLAALLETGKHRDSSGHSHNTQTFAAEVILALRQVIGELPK
ncbi:MAG: hypothetical protein LW865_02155 [Betaproteobacteria bacterium]|jgi:hypothetical protein|nr:hypothetical protein [Betaproteobacteria bacterium]